MQTNPENNHILTKTACLTTYSYVGQVITYTLVITNDGNERSEALGLTQDEIAFYDALETNDCAVKVIPCRLQYRNLLDHSRECTCANVCACKAYPEQLGYPQDKQEKDTLTVLKQAEVLSLEQAAVG